MESIEEVIISARSGNALSSHLSLNGISGARGGSHGHLLLCRHQAEVNGLRVLGLRSALEIKGRILHVQLAACFQMHDGRGSRLKGLVEDEQSGLPH
ncbi:hypothetical protein SKAU_G00200150 [Synaphobranchus kaupii]|uniref:Uncharacterized protein n=1 Tax=Synaphobranchus kaupii TaxID=118154 RepID=A0A9Q1IXS1_SYNKA|nr:hypothetical protein SKAU_G00200150 [Synaphobranchus kaupii]